MVAAPERLTQTAVQSRIQLRAAVLTACALLPLIVPLVWSGLSVRLQTNIALAALSPLEAPWSIREPLSAWALLLCVAWFALAYSGRHTKWWELPLVLLGAAVMLPRVGNAWLTAFLLTVPLYRQLGAASRWLLLAIVICLVASAALLVRSRPPEPRVVALTADGTALGGQPLNSESTEFWLDYLRVVQGHERWQHILDGWRVHRVQVRDAPQLAELVRDSEDWHVLGDDGATLTAERR
jgi:hypothetical protein